MISRFLPSFVQLCQHDFHMKMHLMKVLADSFGKTHEFFCSIKKSSTHTRAYLQKFFTECFIFSNGFVFVNVLKHSLSKTPFLENKESEFKIERNTVEVIGVGTTNGGLDEHQRLHEANTPSTQRVLLTSLLCIFQTDRCAMKRTGFHTNLPYICQSLIVPPQKRRLGPCGMNLLRGFLSIHSSKLYEDSNTGESMSLVLLFRIHRFM